MWLVVKNGDWAPKRHVIQTPSQISIRINLNFRKEFSISVTSNTRGKIMDGSHFALFADSATLRVQSSLLVLILIWECTSDESSKGMHVHVGMDMHVYLYIIENLLIQSQRNPLQVFGYTQIRDLLGDFGPTSFLYFTSIVTS